MKRSFFQAVVVSILLYGCITLTLTKRLEKKIDGIYTRMLQAILNKTWRQYPTSHQLYGHLPPITKTIKLDEPDILRINYKKHLKSIFKKSISFIDVYALRILVTFFDLLLKVEKYFQENSCQMCCVSRALQILNLWKTIKYFMKSTYLCIFQSNFDQ